MKLSSVNTTVGVGLPSSYTIDEDETQPTLKIMHIFRPKIVSLIIEH